MSFSKHLIQRGSRSLLTSAKLISQSCGYSSMPIANSLRINCIDKMNGASRENVWYSNGLSLEKVNVSSAKQLFAQEKHRLPKDLNIHMSKSGINEEIIVLTVNKLNQESTVTLQLRDEFDMNRNQNVTQISKISTDFALAHRPIEAAIEGTLKNYIGKLQQRIDKQAVRDDSKPL